MTDDDKDIMEFLNEQARSEDEGAKICRYAGKLLAMSQARSADPIVAELTSLRARLAEAEARAKPQLPPEVIQALEDFEREMQDKTIPEIIQETKRRERLAAEARQREVGTEQALHHAWRKRAEEAEARAGRAEEAVRVLGGEVEKQRHAANEWADTYYNAKQWLKNIAIGISTPAEALGNLDKCEAHCKEVWDDACNPAARAAVEGAKP